MIILLLVWEYSHFFSRRFAVVAQTFSIGLIEKVLEEIDGVPIQIWYLGKI